MQWQSYKKSTKKTGKLPKNYLDAYLHNQFVLIVMINLPPKHNMLTGLCH